MAQLPTTIALIGYRGVGKTSVACELAELLGRDWHDADVVLQQEAGSTIREIFQQQGEDAFRELEERIVARLCRLDDAVLALGGGAVLRAANRAALQRVRAVWLQAEPAVIWRRLQADAATTGQRPDLTAEGGYAEVAELLARRAPLYAECADLEIDTAGRTPRQIAAEIVSLWQLDAR